MVEHVPHDGRHARMACEQPGRVVTEQVEVDVTVDVVEAGPAGTGHAKGEGVDVQYRPGVATGQHRGGASRRSAALRMVLDVALLRLLDGEIQRVRHVTTVPARPRRRSPRAAAPPANWWRGPLEEVRDRAADHVR